MELRARGRRPWIKLHCYGRLHGSMVYQLAEAEQSVWDKLLCFAGIVNRDGQISDNDGRPFPHSFIADELHTTEELLESTLSKCIEEGRITEDAQGIHITNFLTYQSEYQRQKPYRKKKKAAETMQERSHRLVQEHQAETDCQLSEEEFEKLPRDRQKRADKWRKEHGYG